MRRNRDQSSLFEDDVHPVTLRDMADVIREAGIAGLPSARRRADEARYQEVQVRSALAEAKGMPFRWTLNPYRGCTHACEYCYARKYQRHLELGTGDDFSSVIFVKTNLAQVLRKELTRPSWRHETVAIGTATDPYQPIEGHYKLTRRALEVCRDTQTPISITTKGPMIVRDIDLLRAISRVAAVHIHMSVATVDDEAWEKLEPGTARPLQRLRAARQLQDAGIDVGVLMMPLVPGITTSRAGIERTVRAIADAGLRLIGSNVTHLEPGVREHFFGFLAREYPALLDGYKRLYSGSYAKKEYVSAIKDVVNRCRS